MECYLCRKKVNLLFIKNGYQLFRCPKCGLIFYDFDNDYSTFLKKQYEKGYFTGNPDLNSYFDYGKDKENVVRNLSWCLEGIKEYKKTGSILDVGCAYGYFLELAKKAGYEVYGIDPSPYAIAQAKKNFGDHVIAGSLKEVNFPGKIFDIITMFDVFEHFDDPKGNLQKAGKLLRDNGLLIISTGDTNSFWAKINGRKWTFYNPPQHIFYFNKVNIYQILKETDFSVITIKRNGKWLSLRYIVHLAATVGESKLAKKLYSFFTKTFLGDLSFYLPVMDNMVVFVQKK